MKKKEPLLQIKNLSKVFSKNKQTVTAIHPLSFSIYKGEILALVGESGCGKTTLGRCLLQLYSPTSGNVFFKEQDLTKLSNKQLKPYRKDIQIIFQDPYSSLNPRMTVQQILEEPLIIHNLETTDNRGNRESKIKELLSLVQLNPNHRYRFPHEFSGGERQRIGIARALAVNPSFLVCDEPLSALDVSIQAQIVHLLLDLQKKLQMTYLFIAHDLAMVEYLATRVIVMYLGSFVEVAPKEKLYSSPLHPYTQLLLSSVPIPDPKKERERKKLKKEEGERIKGEEEKECPGCPFAPRCPHAKEQCLKEKPELKEVLPNHFVACFLY